MDQHKPRLIEVDFPIRKVSEESVREKNIRHGHISTLHIWWARRPLASSRATTLAALLPDDPNRREELLALVRDISPWEVVSSKAIHRREGRAINGSTTNPLIQKARELIREAYGGRAPRVLDCFAGGGSIPLEALRLGCETYAMDYNPVAVLILKAVLEYPQEFGKPVARTDAADGSLGLATERTVNPLLEAVKYWGNWVLEEARKELEQFYPKDPDGSIPVGYIWARTLPCQNPACGAEIPLMRQTWLARKEKKKIALKLIPNKKAKRVDPKIVQDAEIDFDPEEGTIARAHVRCPVCNGTIDDDTTRALFRAGKASQRMMVVVLSHPKRTGKTYRLAIERDAQTFRAAAVALEQKRQALWSEWGIDPVPDEALPIERAQGSSGFRSILYGLTRWGDLFNARQKLALITFAEKVRHVHAQMHAEGADVEFAKAGATYLALAVDMTAAFCNTLARWENTSEAIKQLFSRQALPMLWDYAELHPFSGSTGSSEAGWEYYLEVLSHFTRISNSQSLIPNPDVHHASATALPWPDNFFDAVLTDPPYYDNMAYADLADFFTFGSNGPSGTFIPIFSPHLLRPSRKKSSKTQGEIRITHGSQRCSLGHSAKFTAFSNLMELQ